MAERKVFTCDRFAWEKTIREIVVPDHLRAVKVVGLMLATYADQDGTSVRPGERRLAARCQLTDRTVREALKWLRQNLLIHRHARGSNVGLRNYADTYQLCRPEGWETYFQFIDGDDD